jgi:tryptophan-rich sensory protein
VAWSALFFGQQNPGAAFGDIVLLWLAIAATMAAFRPFSPAAAWLLAPYLVWVTFAGVLNLTVWRLNG